MGTAHPTDQRREITMKRKRATLYSTFVLLLLLSPANAQEFADPLAHKLTDFLPTYTPFTPPEPPDRYFPDEVGKKVADAIIDGYLHDHTALEQRVRELSRHDATLAARGQRVTGVTPHVRVLLHSSQTIGEQDDLEATNLGAAPGELRARADL